MIELTDWPYPNAVKGSQYFLQGLLVEMERDYMLANDALHDERDALAVENARLCDDLLSAQGTLLMIREYLRGEHSDTSAQDMIDEIARALESEPRHE